MMTDTVFNSEQQLAEQVGIPLADLLAPIEDRMPAGISVRYNGIYQTIKEARREDDPSLPQGVWVHDLKQADWTTVADVAADAIANKSKDLQLGFWLLEAQIHRFGFAGIAPCMTLLHSLCETYWENMHPEIVDDDLEYRLNPVGWANDKLLPALRLVPITAAGSGERSFSWSDWELANLSQQAELDRETATLGVMDIQAAISATPTGHYRALHAELETALAEIERFIGLLDEQCGNQSPSLGKVTGLLNDIYALVDDQLRKRGVLMAAAPADSDPAGGAEDAGGSAGGGGSGGPITNRDQAYNALAEAAEYLVRVEPHSPAPYLVMRAIEWGNLTTPELYQELFVQHQGQLNIFDVLGITLNDQ